MLKRASIKNLTVFSQANLEFASGLNIIVGENGMGKSHLLKVMYSVIAAGCDPKTTTVPNPTQTYLQKAYADKLVAVLRPEYLGRLARRKPGTERCELEFSFSSAAGGSKKNPLFDQYIKTLSTSFGFSTRSKSEVNVSAIPTQWQPKSPVFFPTRELVTLCPWFVGFYDNYHLKFEETWRDTCSLLTAPTIKGQREKQIATMLKPLEDAMGGKVVVDTVTGNFYLQVIGEGKLEMSLVAEGLRKLAMLARLISTGTLLEQGYLFWDEPETNLNPKLIKLIAKVILDLSKSGVQVFIATHSLFMLREFEILLASDYQKLETQFFGLRLSDDGVIIEQGRIIDDIGDITALEESLQQSDRYLATGSWSDLPKNKD